MGKWRMDYSACEGYDEFMAAEVVLPLLLLNIIIDLKSEEKKQAKEVILSEYHYRMVWSDQGTPP